MIKKRKKRPIYSISQKRFNTFKEMKSFIWHNSHTDEEIQGFEMIDDEIQKQLITKLQPPALGNNSWIASSSKWK